MAPYLGDFREDATLYFYWSSNDGDGASITRAVDGTVSVYKDDNVAQSVAGITDTEDFDAVTGIHMCKIDTSADAFYATGSDYAVVLSAATIDGQTVNAVLAMFSIENRVVESVTGNVDGDVTGNVQGVLDGFSAAAKAEIEAEVDDALATYDGPTDAEMLAAHATTDALIAALNDPTAAATADAVWNEVASGHVTEGTFGQALGLPVLRANTAQQGFLNGIKLDAGASADDAWYDWNYVLLASGTGAGQVRLITNYVGATKVASTEPDWETTPAADSHFMVLANSYVARGKSSETAMAEALLTATTSSVEPAASWRTLYGLISAMTHLHERDAGDNNIVIYKSNDVDVLVTIPITKDVDLAPIKKMDPP